MNRAVWCSALHGFSVARKKALYGKGILMSLRKDDLERAVDGLLCPRHYEYLLYVRSQLEHQTADIQAKKHKAAEDVIKMVRAARPTVPTLGVSDALHVLKEALRRIK